MAIAVIGAGMGRTGTHSLNLALEALGLGPCHHMSDVNANPVQRALWRAAGRGETIDWDAAYEGYASAVDWPTAYFWRELADYYPHAKFILTIRDPETWYRSIARTIAEVVGADAESQSFGVAVIRNKVFGGRINDPQHCMAVFEAHNAAVKAEIAPERLLVYQVSEGWPPLCDFLGLPIPDQPFPATNSAETFREQILRR